MQIHDSTQNPLHLYPRKTATKGSRNASPESKSQKKYLKGSKKSKGSKNTSLNHKTAQKAKPPQANTTRPNIISSGPD